MDLPPPRTIVMASSEAVPFVKTGGLGDVVGALSEALARRGHVVKLILPLFRSALEALPSNVVRMPIPIEIGGQTVSAQIVRCPSRAGWPEALFVDYPPFFDRENLYVDGDGRDYSDNSQRFALFSKAVVEAANLLEWNVDVFHAHDWHAGLVPVYLRTTHAADPRFRSAAVVYTIHNVAYQGRFPVSEFPETGLDSSLLSVDGLEYWGDWSMMKGGILWSDQITTVSPTYAREIRQPEFGEGMDGVIQSRQGRLTGITNGIDLETWNPATDPSLVRHYDRATWRQGKRACKEELLAKAGFPLHADYPLVGMVGRMTNQKGYDVLASIAKNLLATDLRFVVLGMGDVAIEEMMRQWGRMYPDRVWVRIAFDEPLARQIYSASDMFLMPSRFEPCGLSQLYALRYGSIPIVHATGGLVDTVRDATPANLEQGTATGFHFRPFEAARIIDALTRAREAFCAPGAWARLVDRAMSEDSSWDKSAVCYEEVYEQSITEHRKKCQGFSAI